MFEANGIVYASNPTEEMRVCSVRGVGNACLVVTFDTGEDGLLDTTEHLDMPAFAPLADPVIAESAKVDHGALVWLDGAIDLAPQAAYDMSYEYISPAKAV